MVPTPTAAAEHASSRRAEVPFIAIVHRMPVFRTSLPRAARVSATVLAATLLSAPAAQAAEMGLPTGTCSGDPAVTRALSLDVNKQTSRGLYAPRTNGSAERSPGRPRARR